MQVREPSGAVRADAAVAAGNALSSTAELTGHPAVAAQLLGAACEAYRAALAAEEDAMTHSNLADVLVSDMLRCHIFMAGCKEMMLAAEEGAMLHSNFSDALVGVADVVDQRVFCGAYGATPAMEDD